MFLNPKNLDIARMEWFLLRLSLIFSINTAVNSTPVDHLNANLISIFVLHHRQAPLDYNNEGFKADFDLGSKCFLIREETLAFGNKIFLYM